MLNYIRAEAYKLLCRPYTYITLAVMLALEGIFAEGFAFHNSHSSATPFGGAIVNIVGMGVIGFCMCMLTGDIVFAGQYKNSTLKNEVSFGLSRTRIYLGKLIAQTLLSLVYLVVMMAFFIGLCAICLPMEGPAGFYSSGDALFIVGYFLAAALPLWLGAQAAMCMCLFLTSGEMTSYFLYVGLVFVLETVVDVVGLLVGGGFGELLLNIRRHFPGFLMAAPRSLGGDGGRVGRGGLGGGCGVAALTAIGLFGGRRKACL